MALYFSNIILKSNQTYYHNNNIENSMHHNIMCSYLYARTYTLSGISVATYQTLCVSMYIIYYYMYSNIMEKSCTIPCVHAYSLCIIMYVILCVCISTYNIMYGCICVH